MNSQSTQIWMFLKAVLVVTSVLTSASPVPTSEPELTTLLTTEAVTVTTSSPIVLHFHGNAHLSSVYTLQPTETTAFPETDLYATTEYRYQPDGEKIGIDPAKPADNGSTSREVPQDATHFEQVAYTEDNKRHYVNTASHVTGADQRESADKEVQTTVSWSSTALAETTTVPQEVTESPDLPVHVTSHGLSADLSTNVTYKPTEAGNKLSEEPLKSASAPVQAKPDYVATDPTVKVEYATTEIPTTVLPTEKTFSSNTTGEEPATPTDEVPVSSEDVPTTSAIFVSTGLIQATNSSESLESQRGSRHFIKETSKPVPGNETEVQSEVTSSESMSTEPTTISVTQAPEVTTNSEQPQPVTSTPVHTEESTLAVEEANSNKLAPTNQSAIHNISTEVTVVPVDETSANIPETSADVQVNTTSPQYPDTTQKPTTRALGISRSTETKSSETTLIKEVPSKPDKELTSSTIGPSPTSSESNGSKVTITDTIADTATWLSPETTRVSSPSSASLESGASAAAKVAGGASRSVECSPEPVVSVFQGEVRYFIVLGLTACLVATAIILVILLLIRLRAEKRRDTSPSLQLCGCLGRTHRAEITPRRAEVPLEVKQRPGCNLASDVDCRAGEGEDVPLTASTRTGIPSIGRTPAPPAPVSPPTTVKPNGTPLPPKADDSPV